jgi:hypothetical protein
MEADITGLKTTAVTKAPPAAKAVNEKTIVVDKIVNELLSECQSAVDRGGPPPDTQFINEVLDGIHLQDDDQQAVNEQTEFF